MFDRLFKFNMGMLHVFILELQNNFYTEKVPLRCEAAVSAGEVPFEERLTLDYKKISPGDKWGEDWESAWFHVTGKIPGNWDREKVKLLFHLGGGRIDL